MFTGGSEHVLDAKGRTSIPAKFREVLSGCADDRLVLSMDLQGQCLEVRPYDDWNELLERVRALPVTHPARRHFERVVVGQAEILTTDKQGRILVPPALREKVGLDKAVYFVGQIDRFQIWDSAAWQKALAESERFGADNPDAFADLGI